MLPGVNPKMLQKAMKQMGVKERELDAVEVLITTSSGNKLIVSDPVVKEIEMMGQKSLQVTGEISEVSGILDEDVETVCAQTGVSKDEAREALEKAGGDLAEAILQLQNG